MVSECGSKLRVATNFLIAVSLISVSGRTLAVGPTTTRSIAELAQNNKQSDSARMDPQVESAALELVQTHLTELNGVLERLRADDPRQYVRAITDLAKSAKKLEVARNRDERLFEIEVETLQATNAVNLLTAKLKVRDNASDRKLLRKAVSRLQQAQLARAQYDVDALRTRLERTGQQLKSAQDRLDVKRQGGDQQLEKVYATFLRKAGRQVDPGSAENKSDESASKNPASKNNRD